MNHFVIEQWKEYIIPNPAKTRYAVSNHGRVKSFTTSINEGRIVKGTVTEGFLFIRYKRQTNGIIKNFHISVHRIIAELFIPKDNDEQEYVLHLDYDKLNNQLYNLKWATYTEMRAHMNGCLLYT